MSSVQIREMMRNPAALMKFQSTGKLAQLHVPSSPLIALMDQIGPGYLQHFKGLTIDQKLGYRGSRDFAYASQAMNWLKPSSASCNPCPSESWQDKRFVEKLYLDDLVANCREVPQLILDRLSRLSRPSTAKPLPRP